MSVYTCVTQQQLELFLLLYSIGDLVSFFGIKEGIENTNYAVSTTEGEFILTIYESMSEKELPQFFLLLNNLRQNNFPAPIPQLCRMGCFSSLLRGKPAAIFNCLPGQSINTPSVDHCYQIGEYLGKLHSCTYDSNFQQKNSKDLSGCQSIFDEIKLRIDKEHISLLDSELNYLTSISLPVLPQGVIHADLFKDNVLFEQGRISGILDFYNACNDFYLFDIAVTCNDWCIENEVFKTEKFLSLLLGYQQIRALTEDENYYLPFFLRLAALRFYLSRLEHQLNPKTGELTLEKDPMVFSRLLEYHRVNMMDAIQ